MFGNVLEVFGNVLEMDLNIFCGDNELSRISIYVNPEERIEFNEKTSKNSLKVYKK